MFLAVVAFAVGCQAQVADSTVGTEWAAPAAGDSGHSTPDESGGDSNSDSSDPPTPTAWYPDRDGDAATAEAQRVTNGEVVFDQVGPAVDGAGAGDVIAVCPGAYDGPIVVDVPLTIASSGNADDTVLSGGGTVVTASGDLSVTDSTISGNDAMLFGGGIWAGGNATFTDTELSENSAAYLGAALLVDGSVLLDGSAILRNAGGYGAVAIGRDGSLGSRGTEWGSGHDDNEGDLAADDGSWRLAEAPAGDFDCSDTGCSGR